MIGKTNNKGQLIEPIYNYNNLLVWFDGTDFNNHAPTGTNVTAINKNNYNTITTRNFYKKSISMYYKASGSSNGIDITANIPINFKDITISAWAYRTSESNYNNIFTIGNDSASFLELRARQSTTNKGNILVLTTSDNPFTWNNWTFGFLVATIKNNVGTAYFNGNLIGTQNATNNFSTYKNFRILGSTCWSSDTGGQNYVTDCRMYNYALTADEILNLYKIGPQEHSILT